MTHYRNLEQTTSTSISFTGKLFARDLVSSFLSPDFFEGQWHLKRMVRLTSILPRILIQLGRKWKKWLRRERLEISASASAFFARYPKKEVDRRALLYFSFSVRRLQNLTANPLEIRPAINQVELNFWNPQPELVKVRRT